MDNIEKLRQLKQLLDEGILSQEEFDSRKKRILFPDFNGNELESEKESETQPDVILDKEQPLEGQVSEAETVEPARPEPVRTVPAEANKSNKTVIVIVCAAAAVLIAVAAFFFLGRGGAEDEAITQTTEATEETEQKNAEITGATEFNGNYYEVVNYGTDWLDAKNACEDRGGHLAIITSQEEEDFIESLIEENKSEDIYHYWLGATDEKEEGTWTWLDGTVFWIGGPADQGGHSVNGMYNNWLPSQPNNSVKEDPNGQDYLEIQVTMGNEGVAEYMTWTDITEDGVAYGYEGPDDYNDTQYYGHIIEWEGDEL